MDDEGEERKIRPRRIRPRSEDPIIRHRKKEPPKPWTSVERSVVVGVFVITVVLSGLLAIISRAWKLPGLPRLKFPSFSQVKLLKSGTIILEGGVKPEDSKLKAFSMKKDKIIQGFSEAVKNESGVYGLYVVDLESGYSFGVNENEIFQAASLIKLPVMIGLLDSRVDLVERMGLKSDNAAFMEGRKILGDDKINEIAAGLGMERTDVKTNNTTPRDIGLFFVKEKNNDKLLNFLTNTIFEEHLRAGIPSEFRVAHKYGREVNVVNDAGIVFTPKPYVVVIMSKGIILSKADTLFPALSRLVFEGMYSSGDSK